MLEVIIREFKHHIQRTKDGVSEIQSQVLEVNSEQWKC